MDKAGLCISPINAKRTTMFGAPPDSMEMHLKYRFKRDMALPTPGSQESNAAVSMPQPPDSMDMHRKHHFKRDVAFQGTVVTPARSSSSVAMPRPPDSMDMHRKHQFRRGLELHAAGSAAMESTSAVAMPPPSSRQTFSSRKDKSWIFYYQQSSSLDVTSLQANVGSESKMTFPHRLHDDTNDERKPKTRMLRAKEERVSQGSASRSEDKSSDRRPSHQHSPYKMTQYARLNSGGESERSQLAADFGCKLSSLQQKLSRMDQPKKPQTIEERVQDAIDRIPRMYLDAPAKKHTSKGAKRVQFARELEEPMFPRRWGQRRGSL
ncbi:hypothetical protein AeNC1_000191 [Aphanomyces euteiches]|nr:hypothetical protein AeNC1_000191 [Aphanomyces euteiches]